MKHSLLLATFVASAALTPEAWCASPQAPLMNEVGTGDNTVTLTLRWGDEVAMDNLAEGVRFETEATVAEIITTALREDSRFYALESGSQLVAFGSTPTAITRPPSP